MSTVLITHRGWLGLCPVYIGDAKSPTPFIDPIHWSLGWLMWLSFWLFDLAALSLDFLGCEYIDGYKLSSVTRLDQPFYIEAD